MKAVKVMGLAAVVILTTLLLGELADYYRESLGEARWFFSAIILTSLGGLAAALIELGAWASEESQNAVKRTARR